MFLLREKRNDNSIIKFSPALGLIFGSAFGCVAGLLANNSMVITAGIGGGLGLVIGAMVYAFTIQKK